MVKPRPLADLGRGVCYGLGLNLAWITLIVLFPSANLVWVWVLLWAMAVLSVTGISVAEGRYFITGGFWLVQLLSFAIWLLGLMQLLSILTQGGM
jgi:hypothetical protein